MIDWTKKALLRPEQLPPFIRELAPKAVSIRCRPVVHGLESGDVAMLRLEDERGVALSRCYVKELHGAAAREAGVYSDILSEIEPPLSPRLLGKEPVRGGVRIYLEAVMPARGWPWRGFNESAKVLGCLSRVHHTAGTPALDKGWDYELELRRRGADLVDLLQLYRTDEVVRDLRPGHRSIRRLVSCLPQARRQAIDSFGTGERFIHGDVHTGNMILRRRGGQLQPALLDWGRARRGHPLEDVSSWLQSLGYWEPQVRRRHDSLLRHYLSVFGHPSKLSRELRDAYWISAASNVIAGAALYHLQIALERTLPGRRRVDAFMATKDALRILRRAAAAVA